MPRVDSLDGLERATGEFEVSDLGLVIEPRAEEIARRSLEESGLLLLGEFHGVAEKPLLIRAATALSYRLASTCTRCAARETHFAQALVTKAATSTTGYLALAVTAAANSRRDLLIRGSSSK